MVWYGISKWVVFRLALYGSYFERALRTWRRDNRQMPLSFILNTRIFTWGHQSPIQITLTHINTTSKVQCVLDDKWRQIGEVINVCLPAQNKSNASWEWPASSATTSNQMVCLPLGFIKTSLNRAACQFDLFIFAYLLTVAIRVYHFPNTTFTQCVIAVLPNKSNSQANFTHFILLYG